MHMEPQNTWKRQSILKKDEQTSLLINKMTAEQHPPASLPSNTPNQMLLSQKATSRRAKEISTAGTEICLHQHLTNTGRCQRCRTSRVQRPPGDSMLSSATTRIPEPDWVALFWGPYQLSRNPL
jgi:hypothetical protein